MFQDHFLNWVKIVRWSSGLRVIVQILHWGLACN